MPEGTATYNPVAKVVKPEGPSSEGSPSDEPGSGGLAAGGSDKDRVASLLILIRRELRFIISEVYPEFQPRAPGGQEFLRDCNTLYESVYPLFEEGRQNILDLKYAELRWVGLTETSLEIKDRRIRWAIDQFHRDWGRRVLGWGPVKIILEVVFKIMNSFLGSLAKILSGIDPIKELKEYVESGLPVMPSG